MKGETVQSLLGKQKNKQQKPKVRYDVTSAE